MRSISICFRSVREAWASDGWLGRLGLAWTRLIGGPRCRDFGPHNRFLNILITCTSRAMALTQTTSLANKILHDCGNAVFLVKNA